MTAQRLLGGEEARRLVGGCGVVFAPSRVAGDAAAALRAAEAIGWPVALKTAAGDVVHKSDAGCVALGIEDAERLGDAYRRVCGNAARAGSASPALVLVEKMTRGLAEVVIGLKRNNTFGAVLLLGLGGIWVEVMRDYALRLCPVTGDEALHMLHELRGLPLLAGGRGRPACDLAALAGMAAAVSRLGAARDDIVELDINPVIALEHGALAIDARVVLRGAQEQ